jgi:hypothetical protein
MPLIHRFVFQKRKYISDKLIDSVPVNAVWQWRPCLRGQRFRFELRDSVLTKSTSRKSLESALTKKWAGSAS